jgi:hypothetical protein
LTASDGAEDDLLGYSGVSISGDRVILGASHKNISGSGSAFAPGAAYVFVRSGTTWTQQQKLLGDDGPGVEEFGGHTVIDGDTVLVGAIYEGSVYAFHWNGTSWERLQKFGADGTNVPNTSNRFGWSFDLDGSQLIIGAVGHSGVGIAYIFAWDGVTWSKQYTLPQSDSSNDRFGYSVALQGDEALVSAPSDDDGAPNAGSVYVFSNPSDPELLVNGSFEVDSDGDFVPDGWRLKNNTGSGHRCNKPAKPPIAFVGQCAFLFKDSPAGNNKLVQNVNLNVHDLNAGDEITLTGFYNKQSAGNLLIHIYVRYESLPESQTLVTLSGTTSGYQPIPALSLTSLAEPTRVRVRILNQTTSGKTWFDGMSLQVTNSTMTELIPLPQAPSNTLSGSK